MSLKKYIAAVACLLPLATPAVAQEYLTGYVGWFDLVDQDNESTQFGAEYRMSQWQYGLRPIVGGNITTDGALYGYAGFNWDIAITPSVYVIPNLAAGLYANGDGKDLGSAIEFRSGIEFAYQMPDQHRVGIAFNHISNASIGDKNPGAETLLVNYSIPLGGSSR